MHCDAGGPALYVSVYFHTHAPLSKKDTQSLSQEIATSVLNADVPRSVREPAVELPFGVRPAQPDAIVIHGSVDGEDKLWQADAGGLVAQLTSKDSAAHQKGSENWEPFFAWLAERAVLASNLNVINRSSSLFDRFMFLLRTYRTVAAEAIARKDERNIETREIPGGRVTTFHMPTWELDRQARWFALAAIDAFFSSTEHILIHIAILSGKVTSGIEVAELAEADWPTKFKRTLEVSDPTTKSLFDKLLEIRRRFRNFVTHGAFGNQGEAFTFHSAAGAVPVLLPHKAGKRRFALTRDMEFGEGIALDVIEEFIAHLWSGEREPAEIYIQKSDLPLILPMASNGTYARAMSSVENMTEFIEYFDDAANMDW